MRVKVRPRFTWPELEEYSSMEQRVKPSFQQLLDLDWVRPSPKPRSMGRSMEDPKAWKPRKAWQLNVKEIGTEKPTLGKNGIQSHASKAGGLVITMVWSRPWATKNGMC